MKTAVSLIFVFFFVLPVGFFVWLLIRGIKNTKADEWEGEVVDKNLNTKRDSDIKGKVNEFYSVNFKTKTGRIVKIAVNKADYSTWKAGDKARKIKGKLGIERI
jgi:hypothetical protein